MMGFVDGVIDNDDKVASSKKHTQLKTRKVLTHTLFMTKMTKIDALFKRVVQGGLWQSVYELKKERITDHRYKNFVFLNHENKQMRYSFQWPVLTLEIVLKESKVTDG